MSSILLILVLMVGPANADQDRNLPDTGKQQLLFSHRYLHPEETDALSPLHLAAAAVPSNRLKELEVMKEINRSQDQIEKADPYSQAESKKRKAWEKRVRLYIRKNSIISGMKPHHVEQSWGSPNTIEKLSEDTEKWVYNRRDGRNQIIYFDRGEVVGWE